MMTNRFKQLFVLFLILVLTIQCSTPVRILEVASDTQPAQAVGATPAPSEWPLAEPTSTLLPTLRSTATSLAAATATITQPAPTPAAQDALQHSCSYNPGIAQLLSETSPEQWIDWVARLSGDQPVRIAGEETRIETRYSPAMFNGQANARAFEWLHALLLEWYPSDQVAVQPFQVEFEGHSLTWNNLILTLPGKTTPDEIVILSAHLDSTSDQPETYAPGAEDNASGSATLIEAARLYRDRSFERTLQIIWFTGEEQGLLGSQAYVATANPVQIAGVVNLDMFGYDSDGDRCFELHVGTLAASNTIGQCVVNSIQAFDLDLTYDYLRAGAIDRSDHGSFWAAGIGAVEFLHDLAENNQPDGCRSKDPNPHYHTTQDVVANLNPQTAFAIAQAAIATAAGMARPVTSH